MILLNGTSLNSDKHRDKKQSRLQRDKVKVNARVAANGTVEEMSNADDADDGELCEDDI